MWMRLVDISPPEELIESFKRWALYQAHKCRKNKFHTPLAHQTHASLTVDDMNQAEPWKPITRYRLGIVVRGLANAMERSDRIYFVGQICENDLPDAARCRYVRGFWSFTGNSGLVQFSNDSSVPDAETFG